jgi:lysophospholipase L1-like esterase
MPRKTIACIGDSLTCINQYQNYPKELQQLLAQTQPNYTWDVKNLGVEGSSVKDWLVWLGGAPATALSARVGKPEATSVLASGCDAIIVMLGTNDAQKGFFNEHDFTSSLTQLASKLRSDCPSASLLLTIPTPIVPSSSFGSFFDAGAINGILPRVIPQIAASLGLVCIDCFNTVTPNGLSQDGVHLGDEGYRMVASAMLDPVLRSIQGLSVAASPAAAAASPDESADKEVESEEEEEEEEEEEAEEVTYDGNATLQTITFRGCW